MRNDFRERTRRMVPLMVAVAFVILGFTMPAQRVLWFSLAALFLVFAFSMRRKLDE